MLSITISIVALVNKTTLRNRRHFQLLEQLNVLSFRIYTSETKNRSSNRHIAVMSSISLGNFPVEIQDD